MFDPRETIDLDERETGEIREWLRFDWDKKERETKISQISRPLAERPSGHRLEYSPKPTPRAQTAQGDYSSDPL